MMDHHRRSKRTARLWMRTTKPPPKQCRQLTRAQWSRPSVSLSAVLRIRTSQARERRRGRTSPNRSKAGKTTPRTSAAHRAWVRRHRCSVPACQQLPIECAHVRSGTDGGIGLKPSDKWTISLCRLHHHEQHEIGEPAFEAKYDLNLRE